MFSCGNFLVLVCSSCWETVPILCCFQGTLCKSRPDFFTASVLLNAFVNAGFPNVLVSVFVFSHVQFCSFFPCTLEGFFSSSSFFIPISQISTGSFIKGQQQQLCRAYQMRLQLYLPQFESEIPYLVHYSKAFLSFTISSHW